MLTHRASCCSFHQTDCRQGRDCPARMNTSDGGESVDLPVMSADDAYGVSYWAMFAFALVAVIAFVAAFNLLFLPNLY